MPINTYQKIPTGGQNKAYVNYKCINEANRCYARGSAKLGRHLSKINYINKTGYFCNAYAKDLLQQLAVENEGVSDQKK